MAAPIIENVQRGADLGGMLTAAGQGGLARLQQQLQFDRQFADQQAQQQVASEQQDRNLAMQLSQQRDMQQAQIDASAQQQKFLADEALKRITVQYGLEEQVKKDAFDNELSKMREQSRLTAKNTEFTYTTQQRIADAKYARAEQMIKSSDRFTPQEKQIALERLGIMRAGISEPTEVLGDPNKPKYQEGEEPGVRITADDGAIWSREMDGNWRLHQSAKDSIQYLQKKSQAELQLKQLEIQAKREELMVRSRIDLMKEDITGYDSQGNEVTRKRTPEEIDKIMEADFGVKPRKEERNWAANLASLGWDIREEDLELGEEVGGSVAFLRTFGDAENAPPEMRAAAIQAAEVVARAAGVDRAAKSKPAKNSGRKQRTDAKKSWRDRLHRSMTKAHTYGY